MTADRGEGPRVEPYSGVGPSSGPGPVHPSTEKTAILVVHGIGQQRPFETLDAFARGLVDHFRDRGPGLRPRRIQHAGWTEVALEVAFDRPATPRGLRRLHLFEYYWAPHTQRLVSDRAVLAWLLRTGLTPLRYLSQNIQAEREALRHLQAAGPEVRGGPRGIARVVLKEVRRALFYYVPALLIVLAALLAMVTFPAAAWRTWDRVGPVIRSARPQGPEDILALAAAAVLVAWGLALLWFVAGTALRVARRGGQNIDRVADRFLLWTLLATLAVWIVAALGLPRIWPRLATSLGAISAMAASLAGQLWPFAVLAVVLLGLRYALRHYLGDVAVYVTADDKAEHFAARSRILAECTDALKRLLTSAERYDRVLLVGHSLGSVIAYDAVNRLLNETWARPHSPGSPTSPTRTQCDVLAGLVTFGSPLDKVYYFFRTRVAAPQAVRAQILSFLFGFRRGRSFRSYGPYTFSYGSSDPVPPEPDPSAFPVVGGEFRWVNVWSRSDPISGFLDHYVLDPADQLGVRGVPLVAHVQYWGNPELYRFIAERLL